MKWGVFVKITRFGRGEESIVIVSGGKLLLAVFELQVFFGKN